MRDRLIKQTLRVIYDNPQEGDMMMDLRDHSWNQLVKMAKEKDTWRESVSDLRSWLNAAPSPPQTQSCKHLQPQSVIRTEKLDSFFTRAKNKRPRKKQKWKITRSPKQKSSSTLRSTESTPPTPLLPLQQQQRPSLKRNQRRK